VCRPVAGLSGNRFSPLTFALARNHHLTDGSFFSHWDQFLIVLLAAIVPTLSAQSNRGFKVAGRNSSLWEFFAHYQRTRARNRTILVVAA